MSVLQPQPGETFRCPLCAWALLVPSDLVVQSPQFATSGVQGMPAVARDPNRPLRTEREIHDHLAGHAIADWLAKVRALEAEVHNRRAAADR